MVAEKYKYQVLHFCHFVILEGILWIYVYTLILINYIIFVYRYTCIFYLMSYLFYVSFQASCCSAVLYVLVCGSIIWQYVNVTHYVSCMDSAFMWYYFSCSTR